MRGIRRYVVSLLIVFLVVGGVLGAVFYLKKEPRLGLDLRGGLSVVLTAPDGTRADILDKTVDILRARVDSAGVAEPEISREGSNNILIQLPGTENPKRLLELIGRTAQLQFRQVKAEIPQEDPNYETIPLSEEDDPAKEVVFLAEGSKAKIQLAPAELTGASIRDASPLVDPQSGAWRVEVRFEREGARKWQEFTGRLACLQGLERRVAIVLDRQVESSPQVAEDVQCNEGIGGGSTVITGDFDENEAKDLALVLSTGALPVELEQSQVVTVSPTLGAEALRSGLAAGGLGLALILLFVLVYYRALGLQTWLGLACFGGILYGLVVLLGETIGWSLTLAGIAGLIVAVGIATDSYIVFYERVKEEVHSGKTLRSSMDRGFGQAWRTLRTANGVTILAAIFLYALAVGPVRGFALALGVATTLDLGIFVAFTWPLAAVLARSKFFAEGRLIGMRRALEGPKRESIIRKIYRSEFNIDFMGRRRLWLVISSVLVAVSAALLVPQVKGLTFGIDFRGGTVFRAPLDREVSAQDVRQVLFDAGHPEAVAQVLRDPTSGRRQLQAQTEAIEDPGERERIAEALASFAGTDEVDVEAVGQKWGRQITTKALRGLGFFLLFVIFYMSWRLEPKMAVSGIAALFHDLAITAGVYAAVGFDVTPATVVGTLTILGYSLYDTVVVFDKIKENVTLPANARKGFKQIANESMNQVLMRSINTSLVTLLPVGSLLFVGSFLLGAETLKDLSLALFVGIAAGTYSSIFVATPLLSYWKEREPRFARSRVAAKVAEAKNREAVAEADSGPPADAIEQIEPETQPSPAAHRDRGAVRTQPRRKSKRRKKGRR